MVPLISYFSIGFEKRFAVFKLGRLRLPYGIRRKSGIVLRRQGGRTEWLRE